MGDNGLFLIYALVIMWTAFIFINLAFFDIREFEACEKIGMEKTTINDFDTCVDSQGNANIVKFECQGLLWAKECSARIIKLQTFGVDYVR